ncbi:MAG TPA: serine/threonine-protein kinase [Polyangia bacterium]|nr:serine/threonine-protein kinase [Polyangia bacterium]
MSDKAPLPSTIPGVGTDLSVGTVVGEYRIEGVAGRGGMGVVYAAVHPVIEKKVAIKVLSGQFSATPELVRRFIDEARAVNRIGHENIIDIFSFGQLPDGRHYFVMEYLEGATLGDRLERNDLARTDIPTLLAQICDALEAAHNKKIIHRDLKPENVWIGASNRGLRVRLLDFGIAKLLDTGDRLVTDVGAVIGTPHFMSPEQCHGRGVDHRTDIYAMGVIMYQLFTGRLPIQGETYAEILAKQVIETPAPPSTFAPMPEALDALIVRCLDKDPAGRPQTAGELASKLASIFPGGWAGTSPPAKVAAAAGVGATTPAMALSATEVQPSGSHAVIPAPSRRFPTAVVLAGVGIVVAVGLGVAWLSGRGSAPINNSAATAPAPAANPPPAPASVVAPPPAAPRVPAAEAAPVRPSPEVGTAPGSRRRAPGELKTEPKSGAQKSGSSRASRSGLVTDNPFE